jgi:RNA polymerase sigma factor (sigma-70 family)
MAPAFDAVYLQGLQNHDPAIEEHFVNCFSKVLRPRLRNRFWRRDTADDATQETLLRVLNYFRAGKTLRSPGNLPAFVNSVSVNVSRELRRFEGRDDPLDPEYETAGSGDPETEAIQREEAECVRAAFFGLSARDRQILESMISHEMDREQVCREVHATREQLRVMLHRACRRLRILAEPRWLRSRL